MRTTTCLTVDVEDFSDGMAVLGHPVERRDQAASLGTLLEEVGAMESRPVLTLFVVGDHASRVRSSLVEFADAGHEIASHGPDHGRLPPGDVAGWLRSGKEMLEDLVGRPVLGFRSPRFDLPPFVTLEGYRDLLAEVGFEYVSDTRRLGSRSPVRELPVLSWHGVQVGGGSYQRLLPFSVVAGAVRRSPGQAVLYYHSYDFDGSVPPLRDVRSPALAKQVLGRARIAGVFRGLARLFGSEACRDAGR